MSTVYRQAVYFPNSSADKRTLTAWAKKCAASIEADKDRLVAGTRMNFRAILHCVPDHLLSYLVFNFHARDFYVAALSPRQFTEKYIPYGDFVDYTVAFEHAAEGLPLVTAHVTQRDYLVPPPGREEEAQKFYTMNFLEFCKG